MPQQHNRQSGRGSWRKPVADSLSTIQTPCFLRRHTDKLFHRIRGLDWLLADEHWWLWSVETEREAMRLLVALAPQLEESYGT